MFKEMLERMYPTWQKRLDFMARCALTFGLRLDSLATIMGEDAQKLRNSFIQQTRYSCNLSYLFDHGYVLADEAMANFKEFFARLGNAFLNKDKEEMVKILNEVGDKKAMELRKKIQENPGSKLSEEDLLVMLNYQLKYFLPSEATANFFGINRSNYIRRVLKLEDKYPKLLSNYHYVVDYYRNLYTRGKGRY